MAENSTPGASLGRLRHLLGRVLGKSRRGARRLTDTAAAAVPGVNLWRSLRAAHVALNVAPGNHVNLTHHAVWPWRAAGADPQCMLTCRAGRWPHGWVALSLRAVSEPGFVLQPVLYIDVGNGFSEATSVPLPAPDALSGVIQQVFRLPVGVRQLRLDPAPDGTGAFAIRDVALHPISSYEALWRLGLRELLAQTPAGERRQVWRGVLWASGRGGMEGAVHHTRTRLAALTETYAGWARAYDTLSATDHRCIDHHLAMMAPLPRITLVMTLGAAPAAAVQRAIRAVQAQRYPAWQLVVVRSVADAPFDRLLEALAHSDARIVLAPPTEAATGSAGAINHAMDAAPSDLLLLLRADGHLRAHALYVMVDALARHPGAAMVYADADQEDASGDRVAPFFKPAWNVELGRSVDLFGPATLVRRTAVRAAGGARDGFGAAVFYDLALRVSEQVDDTAILHVPQVLYHVSHPAPLGSEAARAVREHLQRSGVAAAVCDGAAPGLRRVVYEVPTPAPKASIIIPTRDQLALTRQCIDSIRQRTDYPHYDIVVVDNDSREPATLRYFEILEQTAAAQVIRYARPFNYAAINNVAAQRADGTVLVLLNNDVEVIGADWLRELVSHAMQPTTGAVGALLYYPNDTIQHAGVIIGPGGVAGHVHKHLPRGALGHAGLAAVAQRLTAVTAACLAVRRTVYAEVGGLDEHLAVAFNDVDFCLRLDARGYHNVWTPYAELYHHESISRGLDANPVNLERFARELAFMRQRWGERLGDDPYYNPNRSIDLGAGDLACPPRLVKPWLAPEARPGVTSAEHVPPQSRRHASPA